MMTVPRTQTHPTQDVRTSKEALHSQLSSQSAQPMSSTVCARLSQWMWAGLWGTCEPNPGPSSRQPYQSEPTDCKACRELHVRCDHAKPQCEHCYQQQTLCFYIDPVQKMKRKTRSPATIDTSDVPLIRVPTPRRK